MEDIMRIPTSPPRRTPLQRDRPVDPRSKSPKDLMTSDRCDWLRAHTAPCCRIRATRRRLRFSEAKTAPNTSR